MNPLSFFIFLNLSDRVTGQIVAAVMLKDTVT